jgi:hypothetical protein
MASPHQGKSNMPEKIITQLLSRVRHQTCWPAQVNSDRYPPQDKRASRKIP